MSKDLEEKLKIEFRKINHSDCLMLIKFYENNISIIESINTDLNSENYDLKLEYSIEYGLSLVESGQYTKGVEILSKTISMFENVPNGHKEELENIPIYERLLWNYGIALYRIKKYKDSKVIFDRLIKYKPNNDLYKEWVLVFKLRKVTHLTNPLWISILIWIFFELTIFNELDQLLQLKLSVFGVLMLFTVIGFELYKFILRKKK